MPPNGKIPLPKFNSIEEMAEFLDHVDSDELAWEDANVKYVRPNMVHVSIRIPSEDLRIIRRKALSMGIGYTAAIRMLLHQAIAGEPRPRSYRGTGIRPIIRQRKAKPIDK